MSVDVLRHAWALLAAAELGVWPGHDERMSPQELQDRNALSIVLLDILPRAAWESLPAVMQRWAEEFSAGVVTVAELRASARSVLKQGRTATRSPAEMVGAPFAVPGENTSFNEGDAERLYAYGLSLWFEQLENSPRWRQLPNAIPGEAAAEIDDVFVELQALPENHPAAVGAEDDTSERQLARDARSGRYPTVSISAMVSRTLETCLVIGAPGSGKSTLIQWLTRAVRRGECADFDWAVTIKLSAYAAVLTERAKLSLLEFFFHNLGVEIKDWRPAVFWLRRLAMQQGRILLLLDGWDEVPLAQRATVRDRIKAEAANFVTIITSRPAGLPREVQDRGRIDFYTIAGLADRAREDLVRKTLHNLGRADLTEIVSKRIATDADLQTMAANPFLLGLLVRVLAREGDIRAAHSLAGLYRQITAWIREQYERDRGREDPLVSEHITGLRRLAYQLLFAGRPRYLFGSDELAESLAPRSTAAVLRSRFVNRIDPVYDEHAFLHATFTEYFAACHASKLSGDEFVNFLDRAFASASRLIVLEFLAGIGGEAEEQCQTLAVKWIEAQDRFQRVLLKVARLATAGRWKGSEPLGHFLRDSLWRVIEENRDMALVEGAVRAYAELDPIDLSRRALRARQLDNWAVNCLLESVPAPIAREQGLDALLTGAWADVAGFAVRGGASAEECQEIRRIVADPEVAEEERRHAIMRAGAARDSDAVDLLKTIVENPSVAIELREQAIDSLGAVGDRPSVNALVDYVIGLRQVPDRCARMAAHVLRHCEASQRALDPRGRDRLLRRLAVLPADHARVEFLLTALEGFPIRDGGRLIGRIAQDAAAPASTRALAVRVLTSVANRQLLERIVAEIATEQSNEVADMLLQLAVQRSLRVPLAWLNQKTLASRDRTRRTDLLGIYLRLLPQASARELRDASEFLHKLVKRALDDRSPSACEMAQVLTRALSMVEGAKEQFLAPATLMLARDQLATFADAPQSLPAEQVQLAVALVRFANDTAARHAATRALNTALDDEAWLADADPRARERIAQALANTLVEIAPAELLPFPRECEVVEGALRTKAVRSGWLVFADRIVDAEGQEVARLPGVNAAQPAPPPAPEIADVINELPERSRQILRCYWSIVHEGGLCHRGDTHKKIYDTAKACWNGERGESWSRIVENCLPGEFPQWESWRKILSRIERQFKDRTELAALLRRIGLYRREPKHPRP
ncbi:MAG TPA: NACHT domain-containing protein [Pirellulales bacterium]|jgi:energy-coupling factor transporter ATP-binding protein EcfA2